MSGLQGVKKCLSCEEAVPVTDSPLRASVCSKKTPEVRSRTEDKREGFSGPFISSAMWKETRYFIEGKITAANWSL